MRWLRAPRRLGIIGAIVFAIALVASLPGNAALNPEATNEPLCVQHSALCTERDNPWTYDENTYVSGHDEPSVALLLDDPGLGQFEPATTVTLPTDPAAAAEARRHRQHVELPAPPGLLVRHDHVRRPVCAEPGRELHGRTATRTSTRALTRSRRATSGNTPGQAYMEMQFYPPGWGPISCTDANGSQ